MANKTEMRRNEIAKLVLQKGALTSAELVRRFGVTSETIRKDLNYLDEVGLIRKTHGGGVISTPQLTHSVMPSQARNQSQYKEKFAIVCEAIGLLTGGEVIFVDGGSTALIFTSVLLASGLDCTVVTPSLLVAQKFIEAKCYGRVFLTGGSLAESFMMEGPLVSEAVDKFRYAFSYMGSLGIRYHNGPTIAHHSEADYKKVVIRNSEKTVVMFDHTKFAAGALSQYATWNEVDYIITDDRASWDDFERFGSHPEILLAHPDDKEAPQHTVPDALAPQFS